MNAYHQQEERRFEVLQRQPEYTRSYETRPRTCSRPSCEALVGPDRALCPRCQDDLTGTLAEIVALQEQAKAERLARKAAAE